MRVNPQKRSTKTPGYTVDQSYVKNPVESYVKNPVESCVKNHPVAYSVTAGAVGLVAGALIFGGGNRVSQKDLNRLDTKYQAIVTDLQKKVEVQGLEIKKGQLSATSTALNAQILDRCAQADSTEFSRLVTMQTERDSINNVVSQIDKNIRSKTGK